MIKPEPMQIFLASSAIKASCELLEGMMEAFDVTPTGMTQITYIPHVKDVAIQFKGGLHHSLRGVQCTSVVKRN